MSEINIHLYNIILKTIGIVDITSILFKKEITQKDLGRLQIWVLIYWLLSVLALVGWGIVTLGIVGLSRFQSFKTINMLVYVIYLLIELVGYILLSYMLKNPEKISQEIFKYIKYIFLGITILMILFRLLTIYTITKSTKTTVYFEPNVYMFFNK